MIILIIQMSLIKSNPPRTKVSWGKTGTPLVSMAPIIKSSTRNPVYSMRSQASTANSEEALCLGATFNWTQNRLSDDPKTAFTQTAFIQNSYMLDPVFQKLVTKKEAESTYYLNPRILKHYNLKEQITKTIKTGHLAYADDLIAFLSNRPFNFPNRFMLGLSNGVSIAHMIGIEYDPKNASFRIYDINKQYIGHASKEPHFKEQLNQVICRYNADHSTEPPVTEMHLVYYTSLNS